MTHIGDNLRMLRERRGMTMQELAEKSGISKSSIYRIENGTQTNITQETIQKLADALSVTRGEIEGSPRQGEKLHVVEGFGARLNEFRTKRGISITALAVLIGVDQSTIHRWEREEAKPSRSHIEKLAAALQTHARILFPSNDEKIEPLTFDSAIKMIEDEHAELMKLRHAVDQLQTIAETAPVDEDEMVMLGAFRKAGLLLRLFVLRALTRDKIYADRFVEAFSVATPEDKADLLQSVPKNHQKS